MRSLGELLPEQQIQQLCASGSIDLNSFLQYWHRKWEKAQNYDDVLNAFRFFDYENNGRVRGDVLRRVLTSIGEPFTDQELNQMIQDAGGDPINYQEFVRVMLSKGTA